jgi:hypothetical protein
MIFIIIASVTLSLSDISIHVGVISVEMLSLMFCSPNSLCFFLNIYQSNLIVILSELSKAPLEITELFSYVVDIS